MVRNTPPEQPARLPPKRSLMRQRSIGRSSYQSESADRSGPGCRTEGSAGDPARRNWTLTVAAAVCLRLFAFLRGKAVPGVPQDLLPIPDLETPENLGNLCKLRVIPSSGEQMAGENTKRRSNSTRSVRVPGLLPAGDQEDVAFREPGHEGNLVREGLRSRLNSVNPRSVGFIAES